MKLTGEVWVTTDFSPLNKSVIPSCFPLPTPEDHCQQTHGSSWFSKLDLVKGYHQIELHPDSCPLTTTHTPLGLGQYKCMPLGLADPGASMQCCIEETLAGLDGACEYIDDILIYTSTKEAATTFCARLYIVCMQNASVSSCANVSLVCDRSPS